MLRQISSRELKILLIGLVVLSQLSLPSAFAAPKTSAEPTVKPRSAEANEKGIAAVKRKDFQSAEDLFREAVTADPSNLTAVYNLAGAYVTNKKDELAIHLLEDTIKKFDKDAGLYVRLADSYFSAKNPAAAVRNYELALKLDPEYPKVAKKLGAAYGLMSRITEAEKMYLRAVEQDSADTESLSNLAAIYLANKKPTDAIRAAKTALQQKVDGDTYITLGSAYEMLNDVQNALIAYEKALTLGSTTPKDEISSKIKELKSNS